MNVCAELYQCPCGFKAFRATARNHEGSAAFGVPRLHTNSGGKRRNEEEGRAERHEGVAAATKGVAIEEQQCVSVECNAAMKQANATNQNSGITPRST